MSISCAPELDDCVGLVDFHLRQSCAQREADDGANFHFAAAHQFRGLRHVPGIDANGRESEFHGLFAELADLLARGVGLQQSVIDQMRDLRVNGRDLAAGGNPRRTGFDRFLRLVNAQMPAAVIALRAINLRQLDAAKSALLRAEIREHFLGHGLN